MRNHKVFIPVVNKINKQSGIVKLDLIDYVQLNIKKSELRIKNGYAFSMLWKDYLHRLVLDECLIVDHKNKNRLDCTRLNLRKSDYQLNKANSKPHNDRKYKGVRKSWSKFRATIVVDGKQIHLGTHNTEKEAALAYNKAALKYYGEHSELNNV